MQSPPTQEYDTQRLVPPILHDSWRLRTLSPLGSVLPNALVTGDFDNDAEDEVGLCTTEGVFAVIKPDSRDPIFRCDTFATIAVLLWCPPSRTAVVVELEGFCTVVRNFDCGADPLTFRQPRPCPSNCSCGAVAGSQLFLGSSDRRVYLFTIVTEEKTGGGGPAACGLIAERCFFADAQVFSLCIFTALNVPLLLVATTTDVLLVRGDAQAASQWESERGARQTSSAQTLTKALWRCNINEQRLKLVELLPCSPEMERRATIGTRGAGGAMGAGPGLGGRGGIPPVSGSLVAPAFGERGRVQQQQQREQLHNPRLLPQRQPHPHALFESGDGDRSSSASTEAKRLPTAVACHAATDGTVHFAVTTEDGFMWAYRLSPAALVKHDTGAAANAAGTATSASGSAVTAAASAACVVTAGSPNFTLGSAPHSPSRGSPLTPSTAVSVHAQGDVVVTMLWERRLGTMMQRVVVGPVCTSPTSPVAVTSMSSAGSIYVVDTKNRMLRCDTRWESCSFTATLRKGEHTVFCATLDEIVELVVPCRLLAETNAGGHSQRQRGSGGSRLGAVVADAVGSDSSMSVTAAALNSDTFNAVLDALFPLDSFAARMPNALAADVELCRRRELVDLCLRGISPAEWVELRKKGSRVAT